MTAPGPWLDSRSVCDNGVAPTLASPNASDVTAGAHESTGDAATPVPESDTVCGEPTALDATDTLPAAAPAAVGVNVDEMTQLAPVFRLAPQLCDTPNGAVAEMLLMIKAAEPLLVSVAVRAVDGTATVWLLKASAAGARLTAGASAGAPVPDRLSTAEPLLASEPTVSVAVRAPDAPGANAKPMVHAAPRASVPVAVQLPERRKSPAAVPVRLSALKVSTAAPLLLTVTLCTALELPRPCDVKTSVDAFNEIAGCGEAVPVPLSATAVGEPAALWVMARLPVRAPTAVGANAILTVHDELAATLPPTAQVEPVAIWNSPACAPPSVDPLIAIVALPVLLIVIVCAAEVTLTVWLKLSVDGETPITGFSATPIPDKLVLL